MKTRYEEYHSEGPLLPCIPFLHIHRRFDRPSQATNWHDNPEVQLCVEGEGFVLIDGERYPFHIHVQIRVLNWHKLTKTVSGNICLSPGQQFKIKSVFGQESS